MIKSIAELLETEWAESFDQRTLARGFDYAEQERVRLAQVDERSVHAECEGAGANVYQQVIKLIRYQGYDEVRYECSCPVGSDCKHCVAVMFHLTGNEQALQAGSGNEHLSRDLEA